MKDLWGRRFPDEARTDLDARVRGEAEWRNQRPAHLLLTREMMKGRPSATFRFGHIGQADGAPTLLLMTGYGPEQRRLARESGTHRAEQTTLFGGDEA